MRMTRLVTVGVIAAAVFAAGCSSSDKKDSGSTSNSSNTASNTAAKSAPSNAFNQEVDNAISSFKSHDPSLSKFFDSCAGYAIFPSVAKGGLGVGAAHGDGQVFEGGARVGKAELSQGSIGLQIGGQEYRELVFFKDKAALDSFKSDSFEFAGNASAVAVKSGAATAVDYSNGVAVFTITTAGLMLEASIGGQNFDYTAY